MADPSTNHLTNHVLNVLERISGRLDVLERRSIPNNLEHISQPVGALDLSTQAVTSNRAYITPTTLAASAPATSFPTWTPFSVPPPTFNQPPTVLLPPPPRWETGSTRRQSQSPGDRHRDIHTRGRRPSPPTRPNTRVFTSSTRRGHVSTARQHNDRSTTRTVTFTHNMEHDSTQRGNRPETRHRPISSSPARQGGRFTHDSARPSRDQSGSTSADRGHITSLNLDFVPLIHATARYIQLSQHTINWTSCPRSVTLQLKKLCSSINAPSSTPTFKRDMDQLASSTANSLSQLMRSHLDSQRQHLLTEITSLNTSDFHLVLPIVERMTKRRLQHKFRSDLFKRWADDLRARLALATRPTSDVTAPTTTTVDSAADDQQPSVSADLYDPQRRSPRAASIVDPFLEHIITVPTNNRFALLTSTTEEGETDDVPAPLERRILRSTVRSATSSHTASEDQLSNDTVEALLALHTRTSAASTIPSTSAAPPPPNRRSLSLNSSERQRLLHSEESVNTALSSYINASLGQHTTAYMSNHRQAWKIRKTIEPCEMIVLADSNGASWKTTSSTLKHHVHAFRGARLRDVDAILSRSVDELANCTNIIVAAGINDRISDHPTNIYTDLFAIHDWGRKHKKVISFLEIPMPDDRVPLPQRERIKAINEAAMDVFQQTFIVIDASSVVFATTDSAGIHYTHDTASYLFNLCADFLGHTF